MALEVGFATVRVQDDLCRSGVESRLRRVRGYSCAVPRRRCSGGVYTGPTRASPATILRAGAGGDHAGAAGSAVGDERASSSPRPGKTRPLRTGTRMAPKGQERRPTDTVTTRSTLLGRSPQDRAPRAAQVCL